MWAKPPKDIEIDFSVHLYNITNPEDIKNGAKPNLHQVGPIVFTIKTTKMNVSFYENGTASYFNYVEMHYNEQRSIERQDELMKLDLDHSNRTTEYVFLNSTLNIPNIPLIVIDDIMKRYPIPNFLVRPILNRLGENQIILQKTVNETLFGYEDEALKSVADLAIVKKLNIDIDPHFGLLAGQNGTTNPGNFLVDLGKNSYLQANEILQINGSPNVNYWKSDHANSIDGTDGQQMHPFINRSENVTTYCSDIFRSIWMYYTHDDDIFGVTTYHYELPPEVFSLPEVFPPNQGFCVDQPCDKKGNCKCPPGSGVLNISPAEPMNAPVYVSQPHFLHADPLYREAYTGLSEPNKT